jgi:hypothetical protein
MTKQSKQKCKTSRLLSRSPVSDPMPEVIIKMDEVLWEFSKRYGTLYTAQTGICLGERAAAVAGLLAFENSGDAVRCANSDGSITWKATPKFLCETGLEAGSLVTFRPGRKPEEVCE